MRISRVLLLVLTCMSCADIVGLKDRQLGDEGGAPQNDASSDVVGVPDAAGPDAAPTCWPFVPSNYDPCAPDFATKYPLLGPMMVSANASINTMNTGVQIGSFTILHYSFLTVQAGTTLTVTGGRPAIFVLDMDAQIYGTIVVQAVNMDDMACALMIPGDTGTNCSPGGAGGGFGQAGGSSGGSCQGVTMGPVANGFPDLSPLRGGCRGGNSGASKPGGMVAVGGVSGGVGGGAIEISAKASILIAMTGAIYANGGGGSGGGAKVWSQCLSMPSMHDCSSGGGGGGSGGAILLESAAVSVHGNTCAVGGGGGGGGGRSGNNGGGGGTSATCMPGSAGAGSTMANGGNAGGVGGYSSPPTNGGNADGSNYGSSGGGGGGAGRIHFRSVMPLVTTGATIVPAAM